MYCDVYYKVHEEAPFGSKLQLWTRSRTVYAGCDLSQVSMPRLDGPKSIIGQKQRHILYSRKAEAEFVSTILSIMPFEIMDPSSFFRLAAGDSEIIGTRVRLPSNHHAWQLIASARQTP